MKNCLLGCEFMLMGYCNLHEEKLSTRFIEHGKIAYVRCKPCEEEKEALDIVEDLNKLEEVLKKYEDKGLPITSEAEKRRRLLHEVESR